MELANTILGIIASAFSIAATVVALLNRSEIKKLTDSHDRYQQKAKGSGNTQTINRTTIDGRHE